MLHKKLEKALNDQIKWEFFSAYLYLSMQAQFADMGLAGFAKCMEAQVREELFHGMKMFRYVIEAGGKVTLQAVEEPKARWKSPLEAFEDALAHEGKVTARINALVDLAQKERDHATVNFLQWFAGEQVEEEASVADVIAKLKLVGDGGALFLLDKDLGLRVFTPPAAAA